MDNNNSNQEINVGDNQELSAEQSTTAALNLDDLRKKQNLPLAIFGGLFSAIIGACLWALVTVLTKYQIGYMAIAVGLLVGFAVRFMGKGIDIQFSIVGAVFALLGCAMGNYFSAIGFFAEEMNTTFFSALRMFDLSTIPSIMAETFAPMDFLFYALAGYEGFKFATIPLE